MTKWAVELSAFDISYQPRVSVKAQVLADFINEMPLSESSAINENQLEEWIVNVDGSSCSKRAGAGVSIMTPEGDNLDYAITLNFLATNNQAEYEALLWGLSLVKEAGAKNIVVRTDSQLVSKQVQGEYEVKDSSMEQYSSKARIELQNFQKWRIDQIPRAENTRADFMARMASGSEEIGTRKVTLLSSSVPKIAAEVEMVEIEDSKPSWKTPIEDYFRGIFPKSPSELRKVKFKSSRYVIEDGILYRKACDQPLKRCLDSKEANIVLREIHEGSCGNHSSGRALAYKALRQGYYWPTMMKDSISIAKTCQKCQYHARMTHQPAVEQEPTQISCPFDQWGIDIVGPFPMASRQRKWMVVAVEYFSKWIEAEALATITEAAMIDFVWKNIICRFGIPRILVSDNGTQFAGKRIRAWCQELKIRQVFSSVAYPQANGQVEVSNRTLLESIARRLENARGNWSEELPGVLWAYRTTSRASTGETPYSLVFGSEAVIPAEIAIPSRRIRNYEAADSEEARLRELDLLEERREQALIRIEKYKSQMARGFNKRVKHRSFQVGDLVLRNREVTQHVGKLQPRWEGPYKIIKVARAGTYKLSTLADEEVPRTWNIIHLKKFYV